LKDIDCDEWGVDVKSFRNMAPLTFRRLTSTIVDVPHC